MHTSHYINTSGVEWGGGSPEHIIISRTDGGAITINGAVHYEVRGAYEFLREYIVGIAKRSRG